MTPSPPEAAWLEADEWEGENGILGNRRGLEVLRDAIDQVLMNPQEAAMIPMNEGSIRILKLCDCDPPPPLSTPTPLSEKILLFGLLGLFLLILLLGVTRLIDLAVSLFS